MQFRADYLWYLPLNVSNYFTGKDILTQIKDDGATRKEYFDVLYGLAINEGSKMYSFDLMEAIINSKDYRYVYLRR